MRPPSAFTDCIKFISSVGEAARSQHAPHTRRPIMLPLGHLGTRTKESIHWVLEHLPGREGDKIRPGLEMRLNLPDEQFSAVANGHNMQPL